MTRAPQARLLHVAALPFPSYQGTQALLKAILETSAAAERDVELLAYDTAGYPFEPSFRLTRAPAIGSRSLRSGPSAGKLVADAGLAVALKARCRSLRPDAVIAHHVEAASVAPAKLPLVFFAHTDLGGELPAFLPALFSVPLGIAGRVLDRRLARRAHAIATVSPCLQARFAALARPSTLVRYVPAPWSLTEPARPAERIRTRERLGIDGSSFVVLYAGNLDAYQGWTRLVRALAKTPSAVLVVATQSDASSLWMEAQDIGVAHRLRVTAVDGEQTRRDLHAAADVAAIVRGVLGGIPIKLLDALSRGLPCVVSPTAAAGLPLGDAVLHCADEHPDALAATLAELRELDEQARRALGEAGRGYIEREHSSARFFDAFDTLVAHALDHGRAGA